MGGRYGGVPQKAAPPPGSIVGFAGGESRIESPFAGVERKPPLGLGIHRRTEVLQAKMSPPQGIVSADLGSAGADGPPRPIYRRGNVLQAKMRSFPHIAPHM